MSDNLPTVPSRAPRGGQPVGAWVFAGAILVGAFLLFQVQPIVGKRILPWYGGVPAVWTTCLLFFQTLLFFGYLYAHLLQQCFTPRRQAYVHLAVIAAAALVAPIGPSDFWKPLDSSWPIPRILGLLTATVGLPYLVLSCSSPLLQAWFAAAHPGRSPYRLYAVSNVGSLAALLTYPVVVEPWLPLAAQAWLWSGAFVAYGLLAAGCAVAVWRLVPAETHLEPSAAGGSNALASAGHSSSATAETPLAMSRHAGTTARTELPPHWSDRLMWLVLPGVASLLLMATTNHVCQDVAVIPFLWVLPLTIYLLSFIICFDSPRWYSRWLWPPLALAAFFGIALHSTRYLEGYAWARDSFLLAPFTEDHFPLQIALSSAALFAVCMICHGEVYRLRPRPARLTEYYLLIAAGGALGGSFVSVIAPLTFNALIEWPIGLCLGFVIASASLAFASRRVAWQIAVATVAVTALTIVAVLSQERGGPNVLARSRGFYGVLTVLEPPPESLAPRSRSLRNGIIEHGMQFRDEFWRHEPTTYYARHSGVGLALDYFARKGKPIRAAVVGLGTGTLAAYGRKGDVFRFYEINANVVAIADRWFDYIRDAAAAGTTIEIVLGDARLSMEREIKEGRLQHYQLIALDAFTSDSIPIHLLTDEALGLYDKHLAPDGVIAVHVSNRHLMLAPIVRRLAAKHGFQCIHLDYDPDTDEDAAGANEYDEGLYASEWLLLTRNQSLVDSLPLGIAPRESDKRAPLWTDQYSNLFQILRRRAEKAPADGP